MKKIIVLFMAIFLGFAPLAKADEGMWLPLFIDRLNYVDMQKMGLQLTAEEIYSVNNSSLKDAIIIFGRGCTGEIISDQGLILTNHHCGFGQIQSHSSVEHDYLTDGFWARSFEEELPNDGLVAKFLIRIEDVTQKINDSLTEEMSEDDRVKMIRKIRSKLEEEATKDTDYNASVTSLFEGNEFYLFVYETFRDVRLVGAPPSSIGKFGHDTDNWMWPRHTGDFSLFRVYADADGKPADFSKENKPLKPKLSLPICIDGIKKNDFAMIMGYPGGTDRYMTSYGIQENLDQVYPTRIKIRRKKLDIMHEDMQASDEIRIKYATKYAHTSNYWKNFIGMSKGLKRLKVVDQKKALEDDFTAWVGANDDRKAKYGECLDLISSAYTDKKSFNMAFYYFIEAIYSGPEILRFSYGANKLLQELNQKEPNMEKVRMMTEELKPEVEKYFKDYNRATDMKLFAAMMEMYHEGVPLEQQPGVLLKAAAKYKGNYTKWAEDVYSKSVFDEKESVMALLDNPKAKTILKDPAFTTVSSFFKKFGEIRGQGVASADKLDKGSRHFVAGLREMSPNKKFYPDANFTMRLTYGTVLDYYPADAVHYDYQTTLKGVMEKEDPDNYEFVVSDKLKELYNNKDYGRYGYKGTMYTCFLTNHDITGGNSGSPVINKRGELIGLAFDGNWEAMSGDIAFEPELQRTINVDIRYVLFVIDKYAGAQNLIDEMNIIHNASAIPVLKENNQTRKVNEEIME